MSRTLFSDALLLDGDAPARAGAHVVVEGKEITAVGDGPVEPRPGDRHIDLAGRTLMPGLVSTHYHSTYDGITISPQPLGLEMPPGYLTLVAARNVRRALGEGFTTLVSAGAIGDWIDPQIKLAIDDRLIEGPRLVPGGHGLDAIGGYTDKESWWWQLGNHGSQRICNGADDFVRAVRDEVAHGVEMLKLFPSGGHGVDEEIEELSFTSEELRACVAAAHQRGIRVRAHCPWKKAMLECIRAGVDVIDHGDRIDQQVLDAMLDAGTFLVPGTYLLAHMLGDDRNRVAATDVQMAPVEHDYANIVEWLPRANEQGLRICIGDDFGIIVLPHGDYAAELCFYVDEVGIPPLDVLRWATKHGAELAGLPVGRILPGRLADLLVVDGDPSRDIGVLRDGARIQAIVKDGEFVKDELPAERGA